MTGAATVGGPTINQACATGVRCLPTAAQEIEAGLASAALTRPAIIHLLFRTTD